MRHHLLNLFLLLLLVVGSCKEDEIVTAGPGYFKLSQIKAPNGRVTESIEFDNQFDLGDLKASKEFYFILSNAGESPITDITITTDNPHFIVSPQAISSLDGVNGAGNSFIPLVSLGVKHGIEINGFGFTDILPMGDNFSVVTITGKTVLDGEEKEIQSTFNFKVNAKVMDIEIIDGESIVDLYKPFSYIGLPGAGGLGSLSVFYTPNSTILIKNVGNVDMRIVTKSTIDYLPIQDVVLQPEMSFDFDLPPFPDNSGNKAILFSIYGDGTIADQSRIQQGNDGNGYFVFF